MSSESAYRDRSRFLAGRWLQAGDLDDLDDDDLAGTRAMPHRQAPREDENGPRNKSAARRKPRRRRERHDLDD